MIERIRKRDGRIDTFDIDKIANAIDKSLKATGGHNDIIQAKKLALEVYERLDSMGTSLPTVELVQDTVEEILIEKGLARVAKAYILYREDRTKKRGLTNWNERSIQAITNNTHTSSFYRSDPISSTIGYGITSATVYNEMFSINPKFNEAVNKGEIYIHHPEYYTNSPESIHFDLLKLKKNGAFESFKFEKLSDYFSLIIYSIRLIQREQYGEIVLLDIDRFIAEAVRSAFKTNYLIFLKTAIELSTNMEYIPYFLETIERLDLIPTMENKEPSKDLIRFFQNYKVQSKVLIQKVLDYVYKRTYEKVKADLKDGIIRVTQEIDMSTFSKDTKPTFSFGLDQTKEGRMFDQTLLEILKENPYYSEICNSIFLVRENTNEDIFQMYKYHGKGICFSFIRGESRVYHSNGSSYKFEEPGGISRTTINLPHIALETKGNTEEFYHILEERMNLVMEQLKERYQYLTDTYQVRKNQPDQQRHFSFNFIQKQYEHLYENGTSIISFIGLKESSEITGLDQKEIYDFMKEHIPSGEHRKFNLFIDGVSECATLLAKKDQMIYGTKYEKYSNGVGYENINTIEQLIEATKYFDAFNGGYLINIDASNLDIEEVFKTIDEYKIQFMRIV